MRTLFITRVNPFLKNGGAYAAKAYIDGFNELSEEFTLMLPDKCISADTRPDYRVIEVPERSLINKLLFPITGITHRFTPYIYKLAEENDNFNDYDTIVLNGSVLSGSMIQFFKRLKKRVITLHHNVERNYHMDNKTIDCFWGYCDLYVKKYERRALIQSDVNLSISVSDITELKNRYKGDYNIDYLGCFEDRSRTFPQFGESINGKRAIITGSLGDVQTSESIEYFLDELFPVFRHKCPDWKLTIAGRNPSEKLKIKAELYGVSLIANPEDIDGLIKSHDLYICPTYLGSGLKLRIMDGLRNGLPVITHNVSARGYEGFWEQEFFQIYSDRIGFQKALEQITGKLWDRKAIVEAYQRQFSYSSGRDRLSELLTKHGFIC